MSLYILVITPHENSMLILFYRPCPSTEFKHANSCWNEKCRAQDNPYISVFKIYGKEDASLVRRSLSAGKTDLFAANLRNTAIKFHNSDSEFPSHSLLV